MEEELLMPKKTNKKTEAKSYNHGEEHPQRPDIGTEPHFKKKNPLSPIVMIPPCPRS